MEDRIAQEREEEEVQVLSPFEVLADADSGYQSDETLAASRTRTQLRDIGSQVSVMNEQFISDLAITDLNEAIAYSLNVETADQTYDVTNENNAGNNNSIQVFAGSPRSRGLSGATIGRDFFQTYMPVDAYNTERFTFASGANNMLFGNSSPAGSIGTTTKRASTLKTKGSLLSRIDDQGSYRWVFDGNLPIKKDVFALRYVYLMDRANSFREPSFRDQDRHFLAATFTPWRWASLRGWYENYESHAQPVRNTLLRDRVTPWVEAGSPAFDNRTTANGGKFPPPPTSATSPFFRTPTARTNPYYFMDETGGLGLFRVTNTVQTVGNTRILPAPNNFDWSVTDPELYPLEVGVTGNAIQNLQEGNNYGLVLNLNPLPNFWIEAGGSREYFQHRYADLFRNSELNLYADANLYLNDQVTPNPNFGRQYLEDVITFAGMTIGTYDQVRTSFVYQLDFTRRDSWLKHLGRYNLTALVERLEQQQNGAGQRFNPNLSAPFPGGATGTASTLFYRYYLPAGASGPDMAINLPFDPMQEGNIELPNSGGFFIKGFNSPSGADAGAFLGRTVVNSTAFAAQGFFLRDRVVVNFSRRTDEVSRFDVTGLTFPRLPSGGFAYIDAVYDLPDEENFNLTSKGEKTKDNYGIVVHPLSWLSLHYQKLANGQVTGLTRVNLDGTPVELGTGKGEEFGFSLRFFRNRFTIRVNQYVSTLVGIQGSPLGGVNPVPAAAEGGGNNITDDLPALEQAVLQAGAPLVDRFSEWQQLLLAQTWYPGVPSNPASDPTTLRGIYDFIVDRESKGYEITLTANPTRSWRISVNASKNESEETNLAPQYFDLINERLPVWGQYLNAPTWRNGQTVSELLLPSTGNFYYIQSADGKPNVMDRIYRVTATTAYEFREGFLRNSRVGLNYSWRSAAAVGFAPITVTDNPFTVPGLVGSTISISDVENPFRGAELSTFDLFAGYRLRFLKRKFSWDIQVNIRNLFDNTDLLVQRADSAGVGRVFTIQEPRTFILTNTLSF